MDRCGASPVLRRPTCTPSAGSPAQTPPGPSRGSLPGTLISALPAFHFFVEPTCQAQTINQHLTLTAHQPPTQPGAQAGGG